MTIVCFIIFGEHDIRVREAIAEAISFIDSHVPLETTIIEISEDIKPSFWDNYDCYFAHAGDFNKLIDKIPEGYDIYVCLWKAKDKPVCWSGGTWGVEYGIHNAWLCSLPYDLPDCFDSVGDQYNYRLSQRIVHEILNALHGMGLIEKTPEKCEEYGFYDPIGGWKNCYIECLKTYKGGNMGEWKEVWRRSWTLTIEEEEEPFRPDVLVEEHLKDLPQITETTVNYGYIVVKGLSDVTRRVRCRVLLDNVPARLDGENRVEIKEVSKSKVTSFDVIFDRPPRGSYQVDAVVEQWVE